MKLLDSMFQIKNNYMNYNKLLVITGAFVFISTLHADWKIIPGTEFQKELRVWDAAPELKLDVSWEGARNSRNEAEGEGGLTWRDEKGEVSIYSGTMVGGKREGLGTWLHRSGSKYIGYWKDNLKHGAGEYWLKDGGYYKGEFNKDKPHGTGRIVSVDGVIYEGQFVDGKKQGTGVMKFPDGRIHNSTWENDKDTNPPEPASEPYLVLGIDTQKYALDGEIFSPGTQNSPAITLTYRGTWLDKFFSIVPHWPYFEKWQTGGPIPKADLMPFDLSIQPVYLEIRVFNPSKEKISISSAEIEVEESAPDNQPILAIGDTPESHATFSTVITSFDSKPVDSVKLKFNILPISETPKFENYKYQTILEPFTSKTLWSIKKELESIGVDLSMFDEWANLSKEQPPEASFEQIRSKKEKLLEKIKKNIGPLKKFDDSNGNLSTFSARLAGEITTQWIDYKGEKKEHTVKFNFEKCFFQADVEFGAGGPSSGNYQVMLETNGSNYTRPFAYKRTLASGANDRIGIKLASKESSYQKFRVRLTTTDGTELLSPQCDLRFLVPGGYDWDKGYIIRN